MSWASFFLIADHFHEVKCQEETANCGWKFECQITKNNCLRVYVADSCRKLERPKNKQKEKMKVEKKEKTNENM